MGQTNKPRVKRPDGRILSMKRQRIVNKEQIAAITAQDLKITKKNSKERKQGGREVTYDTPEKRMNEKLLRALRKKMRAIEALHEKQESGEKLDDAQLEKLELYDETKENLERLEKLEEDKR